MRAINKMFQVRHHLIHHRVVDIGVDVGFVVDVDPVCTGLQSTRNKGVTGIGIQVIGA